MNLRLNKRAQLIEGEDSAVLNIIKKNYNYTYKINKSFYKILIFLLTNNDYKKIINELVQRSDMVSAKFLEEINEMIDKEILIETEELVYDQYQIKKYDSHVGISRIFFEVTNDCNMKCIHCYNERNQDNKYLDLNILEKLLMEAHELGVCFVDVTGGEATLHPQIRDILLLFTKYGMFINLYTNGLLLDEKFLLFLEKECRLSSIISSIDSINPEVYNNFRKTEKAYEVVVDNLKVIKDIDIDLRINVTIHEENIGEIVEIAKYANDILGAESVVIAPIVQAGNGKLTSTAEIDKNEILDAQFEAYKKLDFETINNINLGTNTRCGVFESMIYFSPEFEAYVCPTLTKYESDEFILGKYPKDNLLKIFRSLLDREHNYVCEEYDNCKYSKLCMSGCRSRAFLETSKINGIDKYMCEFYEHLSKKYPNLF